MAFSSIRPRKSLEILDPRGLGTNHLDLGGLEHIEDLKKFNANVVGGQL